MNINAKNVKITIFANVDVNVDVNADAIVPMDANVKMDAIVQIVVINPANAVADNS